MESYVDSSRGESVLELDILTLHYAYTLLSSTKTGRPNASQSVVVPYQIPPKMFAAGTQVREVKSTPSVGHLMLSAFCRHSL